jgi:T-complex protein 1 subunit eta
LNNIFTDDGDTYQKFGQLMSNINAYHVIGEILTSTFSPGSMNKLIQNGDRLAMVTKDGITVLREVDIVHPAASLLVDFAKSQDQEMDDGTTLVVVCYWILFALFLKKKLLGHSKYNGKDEKLE